MQAGLLKEGICSVQDESAGIIWSSPDKKYSLLFINSSCCKKFYPNPFLLLISKSLPTSGTAGLIVSVVKPQPGERIMDACAAPGGKTLFMASCLKGQGNITKACGPDILTFIFLCCTSMLN